MTYIRSTIIKQPSGLWKATITTTWFYFGQQDIHETFQTLSEARDWLLSQRCYNLHIEEEQKTIEEQKDRDIEEAKPEPLNIKLKKTWKNIVYDKDDVPVGIVKD